MISAEIPSTGAPAVRTMTTAESLSIWIDLFRWVAATAVVFTHVNNRFFVKILTLPAEERQLSQYLFAMVGGFGRPAVLLFFVISGYLVGGGAANKYIRQGVFSFRDYMVARLSRLWVVLIPALVLVYVLNVIAITHFGANTIGIFGADGDGVAQDAGTFVCNAAFMQLALCHQYGGNGALWSLFHEFWYYVAFPPLMIAVWGVGSLFKRGALIALVALLLGSLAALQFSAPNIAVYFTVWLVGVAAAVMPRRFIPAPPLVVGGVLLICLLAWRIIIPTPKVEDVWSIQTLCDFGLSFLFASLLASMRFAPKLAPPPFAAVHRNMAAFSFSQYCIHTPVLNLYCAFLFVTIGQGWKTVPSGWASYAWALSAVVIAVVCGWLFSLLTECHTPTVRRCVTKILNGVAAKS